MTTGAKEKQRNELLAGIGALAVMLALLLAVAFGLLEGQQPQTLALPAETTLPAQTEAPTEPTLPPPEANPYGPTDFQYQGKYLTCMAGDAALGIDVSEHQEEVDWDAVKAAGMEYVIIRVGYRGYGEGGLYMDALAQSHYEGARAAGLKIGAYFFSQAISPEEAREEAAFLLDAVADWQIDLPLVFDWEYISTEARTGNMDPRTLTDCTIAFCETVKAAGYTPMIYFNQSQSQYLLYMAELKEYDFWLAMYSDRMTYPYKLTMWQYTCTGTVPGIGTEVDINLWFTYE